MESKQKEIIHKEKAMNQEKGKNDREANNAGYNLIQPASSCNDAKCPFHGDLKVRGRVFTGLVFKSKAQKTATVSWERMHYIPKYERYERRRTKLQAHNTSCINAKDGDIVKLMECRPLSKTKHFVIVEKIGRKELKVIEELKKKESKAPEKAAKEKGKSK